MPVEDRTQKIGKIYSSALRLHESERPDYLDLICAGDKDLRREVESLLKCEGKLPGFLETPAAEAFARTVAAEHRPLVGSIIGPYRVISLLGVGGMGEVYLARDTRIGRFVALKTLLWGFETDWKRAQRLLHEAKAISALQHPNIVTLYDITHHEGTDVLVMEYLTGNTLDKLIPPGGLGIQKALEYATQIAAACVKAHAAGIVHRDLKPGNVIVGEDGSVKVLDFGLAKLVANEEPTRMDDRSESTVMSNSGVILGTVPYISPEQAQGAAADPRSDIFSFGVLLYELLTGLRPFEAASRTSMLAAIVSQEPKPLRITKGGPPMDLEDLVLRCLRKDPEARFQSMAAVQIAIAGVTGTASSNSGTTALHRWRYQLRSVLAFAVAVLLIAVSVWLWSRGGTSLTSDRMLTRLTWNGAAAEPAISRDGRLLAYSSVNESRPDIFVQKIGDDRSLQITHDPTGAYHPTFSLDGSHIAFDSLRRGVFETAIAGREARFIALGCCPKYLPDSSQILFRDEQRHLALVPISGGRPKILQKQLLVDSVWLVLSPNGKQVLIPARPVSAPKKYGLWRVSLPDGKMEELTPLVGPRQNEPAVPEAWVMLHGDPRRQWLIFGRWSATSSEPYNSGENRNLFAAPVSSDGKLQSAVQQLTFSPGTAIYTSASDTGRIVFRFDNQSASLRAIPIDTDRAKFMGQVQELKHLQGVFNPAPSLSRDGRKLAFWSGRRVACLNRQTGQEILLSSELHPFESAGPKISPDGSTVVYYVTRDHPNTDLYAIPSSGGVARQICPDCGVPGGLSFDGKNVLTYLNVNGLGVIAEVEIRTGEMRQVLRHPTYSLKDPSFSLDDQWVAFVAQLDDSHSRIFLKKRSSLTDSSESGWVAVTNGEYLDEKPQFSPSGTIMYFVSDRDGSKCIWAQRLDPALKRPVEHPFSIQHFHQSLSIFRSAPEINVTRNEIVTHVDLIPGDIWMMELEHGHS